MTTSWSGPASRPAASRPELMAPVRRSAGRYSLPTLPLTPFQLEAVRRARLRRLRRYTQLLQTIDRAC